MRLSLIAIQRMLERFTWVFFLFLLFLIGHHHWEIHSMPTGVISDTTTQAGSTNGTKKQTKDHPLSLQPTDTSTAITAISKMRKTSLPTSTVTPPKMPAKRKIYVITPTYHRPQQLAELTRLAQTLMHVKDMLWLVIEDAHNKTRQVQELLDRSCIEHVYLLAPMPKEYDREKYELNKLPRGVSNRNRGLEWLRENASTGVFYFADDDNTYDIRLFEEMRNTRMISVWPVGLLSGGFSSPIVRYGRFVGFYTGWKGKRLWQVDMAGFAVSVELLAKRPRAKMPYTVGYEEDGFLRSLYPIRRNEIELRAKNCTQILVWHTQTKTPSPQRELKGPISAYKDTNILELYASLT